MLLLGGQGRPGVAVDIVEVRSAGRGDDGRDQSLHQRRRADPDPAGQAGIEELQRHLRGQNRAAEVDEDEDAGIGVGGGALDRRGDRGGVGAERRVVQARGDLHPRGPPGGEITGERGGRPGQRPVVRDDDDADHRPARRLSARPRPGPPTR